MVKTLSFLILISICMLFHRVADACSCSEETQEELFRKANYVAHIRVVATELRSVEDLRDEMDDFDTWKDNMPEYVRASYKEVEVYKGHKNAPHYLRELPFSPGNCMLGLLAGMNYVVYLQEDSMSVVHLCSGSFGFLYNEDTEDAPIFTQLRSWSKKAP